MPPRDVRVLCADARLRIGFYPGGVPKLAGLARARDAGVARAVPAGVALADGTRVAFQYIQAGVRDGALVARFNPVLSPRG